MLFRSAVLQDVATLYDTDVFQPVISKVEELAGREWGDDPGIDRAIGAIAEHARSASFLIGEDRKSTRLNSSHALISYAVFCLKKKNK